MAAVAPWAAAQVAGDSTTSVLERTKGIVEELPPPGDGVEGEWYGTFSQTTTTGTGDVYAFNEFVHLRFSQDGTRVFGTGTLGSGERLEIEGQLNGTELTATVANVTSAINVRLTALAARTQITGEFTGSGVGATLEGTFTLLR